MIRSHLSEVDLVEYADGTLPEARLGWAEDHLRCCPTCREAVKALQGACAALQSVAAPVAPPHLRQRILTRIAAEPSPAISCRTALGLIHRSLERALPSLDEGMLRLHLEACAACRREYASLTATTRAVRSLPVEPAPAWIRQAAYASRHARRAPAPWSLRLRPALAAASMAAAALLVLFQRGQQVPVSVIATQSAPRSVAQSAPAPAPPAPKQVARLPEAEQVPPSVRVSPESAPAVEENLRAARGERTVPVVVMRSPASSRRQVQPQAQPRQQLAVYYLAPEPAATPADETPRAIQAVRAVAEAASERSPQRRMAKAIESFRVLADEDQPYPQPVSRQSDTGAVSGVSKPAGGSVPDASGAAPAHDTSASGSGQTQAA